MTLDERIYDLEARRRGTTGHVFTVEPRYARFETSGDNEGVPERHC